ncbi:MAG: Ig-like domain-containing protein [Gemmatimonadota bacterium]|nr:Ig-like domain-containing protein [Gemmatimonadota bacterium]
MSSSAGATCPRCGKPISAGARFCMECGLDVSGEQGNVATAMMPSAAEADANALALEMLKQATLGDYEILRELGRGGMATVYLAHDIALDRKVAIKVMAPALILMGEGMSERFKREARTAANLAHPHIIPIYTVKSSGKSLFFVMKFIAGRSLEQIIKDIGPMPVPMVKAILQQVTSALGYAHRHGIVHRDIKPANIMIDEEGFSVVTDFGIAKVAENRALTMTGIAVGTPSYMSPEQCAAKDITGKSDQYSLGVVAYEMLTGRQPFEGDSAMAIMFAHFNEQPRPIGEIRTDCPPEVAQAVMRMLEKAPDKRYGTMEEAANGLGAQPLAHDDPVRLQLVALAKKGSTREILAQVTPPPTSPVPPARTRQVVDAPTTPIPAPRVVSLSVTPGRSDLHVGDAMQLTATPRTAGGTAPGVAVQWSSSDPAIATVTGAGLVTALAPGAAAITATVEGVSAKAQVTVTPVPVDLVLIEPAEAQLAVGDDLALKVVVRDRHGVELHDRPVEWSMSPAGVVQPGAPGRVRALREGAVEIVAECEGVRGSARIGVTPAPVAAVRVAPAETEVRVGDTVSLAATLTDKAGAALTGRAIAWRSADEKLAAVSAAGIVTGLAAGAARIVASAEGKQAEANIRVLPAAVASVNVVAPEPLIAGGKLTLVAQVKDARGKAIGDREVKWSSSSPAIAIVTRDGTVTGMAAGTAKVTAEVEGKSWTVSVTVLPVPAATVTIEGPAAPLAPGATATLKAIVKDAKGLALSGREVQWSSSAPKVAAITGQGVLTAQGPGSAVITATVEGKQAEYRVTVPAPAPVVEAKTEVVPPPATPAAPRAPEARTEVVPPPVKAPVPSPAAEPPSRRAAEPPAGGKGKLIGVVAGVALLATLGYFVLRPKVEEIPPAPVLLPTAAAAVASVTVTGEAAEIAVGRTAQLAAVLKDAEGNEIQGRAVTWASSDGTVADVSGLGAVNGRKAGSATITAESEGKRGTFAVSVIEPTSDLPAQVASVILSSAGRPLEIGQTVQLSATAKDTRGYVLADRTVVWGTNHPEVALVSSSGLVTALGAGSATITASSEGKSAETRVTVNAPKPAPEPPKPEPAKPEPVVTPPPAAVARVTLTPAALALVTGAEGPLGATVFDDKRAPITGRTVQWKSSDTRIASVTDQGVVTGLAKGKATITATVDGKSAEAVVTVADAIVPVASVVLTAGNKNLKVGETVTWSAAARDARGRPLNDRGVSWSSSAPQVATVNGGVITAVAPGTTEIHAESEGKRVSERLTVAAAPAPPPVTPPTTTPTTGGTTALLPRRGVEAGGALACGLAQGGAVCWGAGFTGLIAIEGTGGASQLAVGRAHACALTSGGRAVCWGDNKNSQLGDGGSTSSGPSAVPVTGDLAFSTIAAGAMHSCGLSGGKAYCWGRGKEGQLGDGGTADRKRPVAVKGGQSFVQLAAGGNHTCAITAGGQAYCWGDGFSGQLGFGGQDQQSDPIDVSGGQKYSRIAAGGKHTCALTTGGKAFCWGANESGQVGDGSKSDRGSPVAVAGSQTFSEIAAGANHSCGLTGGGEVYCWGENRQGQLGDGTKADRSRPVPVGGGNFTSISAGEGFSCAMARGGEAMCWGRNDRGQLGDGGTVPRGVPGAVTGQ